VISYWAIVSARFRMLLQYRAAAIAGFGTQLFWGFIRMMIFIAFYHSTTAKQPMSLTQVISYVWLGQAMLAMLPWNVDSDLRALIRGGNVAYELLRPVDLYWLWFSRAIALRTAPTAMRAAPMLVLAALFFGLRPPPTIASGIAWIIVTGATLLLSCAITMLLSISLLWTVAGDGIARLIPAGVIILSGMTVPLPLFPAWAQPILNATPFRFVADVPFRVFMGHIAPRDLPPLLLQEVAWIVALVLLGRWLLSRSTHRLVVQGG
jgi:ABC-2 type transport system permease protein